MLTGQAVMVDFNAKLRAKLRAKPRLVVARSLAIAKVRTAAVEIMMNGATIGIATGCRQSNEPRDPALNSLARWSQWAQRCP